MYSITYRKMKPGWTVESIEKDMAKYKADLEKTGVKVLFWGHPFGVTENIVVVYDVGGNMDNYIKAISNTPFTDANAHFVLGH